MSGGEYTQMGLRLLTMDRGPNGFGFHMYTDKKREGGQYIKKVTKNSPADLAGMLLDDHVVGVDGVDIRLNTHHQVVEKVRSGTGKEKTILVIDPKSEEELLEKEGDIDPSKAIVMIPRTAPQGGTEETDGGGVGGGAGGGAGGRGASGGLNLSSMDAALPRGNKRSEIKHRDWRSSINTYNNL